MKRTTTAILNQSTGLPVVNGTLTVNLAGTTTPAVLYSSNSTASATLPNPLTAAQAAAGFYVADGRYDLLAHDGTRTVTEADFEIFDLIGLSVRSVVVPTGEAGFTVPGVDVRKGGFLAFDASGAPIASSGTGTDAGLRLDLAQSTGARLVKTSDGRSLQQVVDAIYYGQTADLFVVFGQSLTTGRSPQMTSANAIVASAFCFNGGCEAPTMQTLPGDLTTQGLPPANYTSLSPLFQPAGVETWGPALGYQSAKAGVPRSFFFAPGQGSQSGRSLHGSYMQNLRHGLARAVKLLRAAGYEPTIHFIINHGHADADAFDDGSNGGYTPTTQAEYLLIWRKNIATMRVAADQALGYPFTGPVWFQPLLTRGGVASIAANRDIVMAQFNMPANIAGVRMLPPWSQFVNMCLSDLVHPLGSAYRLNAEMVAAFIRSGLTPPRMASKAVGGGTVTVTFDQPVKYGSIPDATSRGNSCDGFNVIDNTGAEVAISSTLVSGTAVTLTVATTANLTGSWYVRNGLQQLGTLNATGNPAALMSRTRMVGLIDVGTAQDGTALQNSSLVQEL